MRYKQYIVLGLILTCVVKLNAQNKDRETVSAEHGMIDMGLEKKTGHSSHPDAQWYPKAGLGLFIHWGLASVKNLDISWPMIPGRPLVNKQLDSAELARVVAQKDYNLNGKPPLITPNEYWNMAKSFNPQNYNPELWIKAAKEAGFKYAVLTTRHHEGFALWPSAYGDFSTKNYMGGKDLIKPFVDACRKYGMKVGLYYSPPNWYFDRDYMSFLYGKVYTSNPGLPKVDGDFNPRRDTKSAEDIKQHQVAYAAMVKGQVEELLTRYGKIDLLWFDGKAPVPNGANAITIEEIHKLQPGIVMNPRMHGKGDFITFERNPPQKDPNTWAEFCNTWTNSWANSNTQPFRSNAFALGEFVSARAWGVNYLLGVGPTADGVFPKAVYENMKVVQEWMIRNGEAVKDVDKLPANEQASVPATLQGNKRYLFAIPKFKNNGKYEEDRIPSKDVILTMNINRSPKSVIILATGQKLDFKYRNQVVSVKFPASLRSNLVDVVKLAF